jgi:SAM-dependent methyltransferase
LTSNCDNPSSSDDLAGLDYEFLRFIGVDSESQRRIQGFYLPLFKGCESVLDLGCGTADFVALLSEHGIQAIGIDSDERAWAAARERGINVVHQDVFSFLEHSEPNSIDGIFAAHLVEHLSYEAVIRLFRLSRQALRPGGRIVVTTPNPRSLLAHLEMFYLHFGHVTFYHPQLLVFLLEFSGFSQAESGENPIGPPPLLERPFPLTEHLPIPLDGLIWQLISWAVHAAKLLICLSILPLAIQLEINFRRQAALVDRLNVPFECYATAIKREDTAK